MAGRPAEHGGIETKRRTVTIDGAWVGEDTPGWFGERLLSVSRRR